jgi:hypothetical protein
MLMAATQEETPQKPGKNATTTADHVNTIDRTAPAGSENSLGAQSVRDGRPATDDSVVEAMDEEATAAPLPAEKSGVRPDTSK